MSRLISGYPSGVLRRLRGADRDRGAVATIVAVLLAGGVLLGMTAIVVDVGTLYAEREELLSGADSAAQTLAGDCVTTGQTCGTGDLARAVAAADANAKDHLSSVDTVCGYESGGRLPACPASSPSDYTACLNTAPTSGVNWVEVHTSTLEPGNKTVLPPTFAQAVVPGYSGATVRACARVAWGPPSGGIALTISQCEWNHYTADGANLAPLPPYPPYPPTGDEHVILLHDPKAPDNGCGAGPPGWDAPGGFGWTDDPNGDCTISILNGQYGGSTGNDFPKPCQDVIYNDWKNRTVVQMPIYEEVKGQGAKMVYTGGTSAGFVITGYSLGSVTQPSWLPGSTATCAKNQSCLFGFFVGPLLLSSGSTPGTGNNYGVTVIKTIG